MDIRRLSQNGGVPQGSVIVPKLFLLRNELVSVAIPYTIRRYLLKWKNLSSSFGKLLIHTSLLDGCWMAFPQETLSINYFAFKYLFHSNFHTQCLANKTTPRILGSIKKNTTNLIINFVLSFKLWIPLEAILRKKI